MKKIISASLAFSMACLLLTSCQKSNVEKIEPEQQTSFFSSAKSRVAFANSIKAHFSQNTDAFKAASSANANGANFIVPFFSNDGYGIFNLTSFDPFTVEVAWFTTDLGVGDFYRENPDGTVSVNINSNRADAVYTPNAFDWSIIPHLGTNAKLSVKYTGPVVIDNYYDDDGNLVFSYRYIDYWSNPGRAVTFTGNGKVGLDGVGPLMNLSMKFLMTPNGQLSYGITLK